jgi:hypothetical protein
MAFTNTVILGVGESPVEVTTGGLTNAELRATAVPVSGPLTDDALRAADLTVALSVSQINDLLESLRCVTVEMRVVSHLLNEGLNMKESLETLRCDIESDLE